MKAAGLLGGVVAGRLRPPAGRDRFRDDGRSDRALPAALAQAAHR